MKNITEEYELQYRCELVSSQYTNVYSVLCASIHSTETLTGPNKVEQFTNSYH